MVELLSDYGANLETMRAMADRVSGGAGDVENLRDDVRAVHAPARDGVAGLLEGRMRNAPLPVSVGAFAVMQRSLFAGAVVRAFTNAVSAYNAGVALLRHRCEALSLSDDLVDERVCSDDPAERAEGRAATDTNFEDARQVLEDELDDGANIAVSRLAGEITDEVLARLWEEVALPVGAQHAFPDSDFVSQVDPDARWATVSAKYFPTQLDEYGNPVGITAERVETLALSAESVADLRVLLDVSETDQVQELLLARLGEYDSSLVLDAANGPSGRDTLDAIAEGTGALRHINERINANGPLTDQDRAYLLGWFSVGPDQLFRQLPNTVDHAVQTTMLGVPQAEEDAYFIQTRRTYLSPVSDAMLNLTNPDVGGFYTTLGGTLDTHRMSHLPEYLAVNYLSDLRNVEIGVPSQFGPEIAEQDGYPHPLAEEGAESSVVYLLDLPEEHGDTAPTLSYVEAWRQDPRVVIPNLERLEGFARLIDASTVQGGDTYMSNLAEHAGLVERQLAELPESHEESLATTFRGLLGHDGEYLGLDPDDLGEHFASEDRLVAEIEDQLGPLVSRGERAVGTMRSVVERN